jgi:hypothetical protein
MGQERQAAPKQPVASPGGEDTEENACWLDPMMALAGSVGNSAMQSRMNPEDPAGATAASPLEPPAAAGSWFGSMLAPDAAAESSELADPAWLSPGGPLNTTPGMLQPFPGSVFGNLQGPAAANPVVAEVKGGEESEPETPAQTEFKDAIQKAVYDGLRKQAFSVAWMSALQHNVGVPVTGVVSLELCDKALELHPVTLKRKEKPGPPALAAMDAALADWRKQFADLKDIPEKGKAPADLTKSGESAGGDAPEDAAFRGMKDLKMGYNAYASTVLKSGKFLGFTVVAHPEFHARLANATEYLKTKLGNLDGAAMAKELGVFAVSDFRPSSASSDQMYHGLGFAIDLNKPTNDWHFGKSDESWDMGPIMGRVAELFGHAEIRSAQTMSKNSNEQTTEGAFEAMQSSNEDLIRYREFADDASKLEAYYNSDECPAAAKKKSFAEWKKVISADQKVLRADLKNAGGKSDKEDRGFMDLHIEVVQAMRDAGGLRWGGTDLGGDSGDLMHFDGGFMSTAQNYRGEVSRERKRQAAAKAAPPAEAP